VSSWQIAEAGGAKVPASHWIGAAEADGA